MNKYDKFLKKALDKMFTYVGFDSFNEQFTKENVDWFNKKEWSEDQNNEFKKWFIEQGKKDLRFPKTMLEKVSNIFVYVIFASCQ